MTGASGHRGATPLYPETPAAADGADGAPRERPNGPCPRRGVSRGESGPHSPQETIRRGRGSRPCPVSRGEFGADSAREIIGR
eukprot:7745107-Pyramimonas_sp.AAC.1